MLNQLTLIGRIAKDSKLQTTRDGGSYTRFTLAVRRPFKNQSGNYDTDFIPCITWGKLSETIVDYCTKGSLISLSGRVHMRTQEFENQKRVTSPEIIGESVVFLHLKRAQQKQGQQVPIPSAPQELEQVARSVTPIHKDIKLNQQFSSIEAPHESQGQTSSTNTITKLTPQDSAPTSNHQVAPAIATSQE